ncbi:hypothetical protein ONS95_012666 [Cadophora gregata]|uniref:uncharacterized protein n=1 Tax=Cadophora gregata TaxID=51156 RepID=UPI0026DB8063|nr:uncharacterized protein ONS95_012666 [Cadophora gregata]KAK0118377.1 hypothetical protein ONS95_012666 [Cadophora gregata]KAK0123446.1 hypothetical protein ONS96_010430 [Cadophora gregata f. sp. sojae]
MDASVPTSATGTRPPVPVASIACMSCRRLKMKCTGSDNPPCDRCAKAGRECIVQRGRPQDSPHSNSSAGSRRRRSQLDDTFSQPAPPPRTFNTSSFQPVNGVGFGRDNQIARFGNSVARTFFPETANVQETSPVAMRSTVATSSQSAVMDRTGANMAETSPDQKASKRPKIGGVRLSLDQISSQNGTLEQAISERDMVQFIDIFRKRLMNFIPLLNAGDLDNAADIISTKKPLAYCICYVTARYVPGGESARSKLLPVVSSILQERVFEPKNTEDEWTMLQALSVLYAYRTAVWNGSSSDGPLEISQRSIKTHVEMYALKLCVHRSISGVKASLRAEDPEIMNTIAFKKYIFWLWLFNMSHHHSIITCTPPSIREDSTIRVAPELLGNFNVGPRIIQVLAEVELCLLWGKISANVNGLGEWWCPPDILDTPVDYVDQGALAHVDSSLRTWSGKWEAFFNSEPLGLGIEFYYRFTRFCLSSVLIRNFRLVDSSLKPSQVDALNRCISDASDFCQLSLELGPSSREAARYMADFGFVMISFSCQFIIHVCGAFHSAVQAPFEHLSKVEEVAQLMKELAINSSQGPCIQSQIIMSKLTRVYEKIAPTGIRAASNSNHGGDQRLNVVLGQDSYMEQQWDMLDFFLEPPRV